MGMCHIGVSRCSHNGCLCKMLYVPGGRKHFPTILHLPKTNITGRAKSGRLTHVKIVAFQVKVRNVPLSLGPRTCTGLRTKTLGGCVCRHVSGQRRCCCGHIFLNYVQTGSFVTSLPRCSNRGLTTCNKDRKKTLALIATTLSSEIGCLTTFCPTLYSVTKCTRGQTKK